MIEATKDYQGDTICPLCTAKFDCQGDEDSWYDGAETNILCPHCFEPLIIETVTRYEARIDVAARRQNQLDNS